MISNFLAQHHNQLHSWFPSLSTFYMIYLANYNLPTSDKALICEKACSPSTNTSYQTVPNTQTDHEHPKPEQEAMKSQIKNMSSLNLLQPDGHFGGGGCWRGRKGKKTKVRRWMIWLRPSLTSFACSVVYGTNAGRSWRTNEDTEK